MSNLFHGWGYLLATSVLTSTSEMAHILLLRQSTWMKSRIYKCIHKYQRYNNINSQKINTFWKMITNKTSSRLDGLEEDRRILPYNDHIAFPRHFLCSHIDQFYNLKYDKKFKRHRIHLYNTSLRYKIWNLQTNIRARGCLYCMYKNIWMKYEY